MLPANAFDGNTSTYAESAEQTLTVTGTYPNGTYAVEVKASSSSTSVSCGGVNLTSQGNNIWTGTVSNPFPVETALASPGKPDLYYVKVDGTFLVDAGEQYNTSATWSNATETSTGANTTTGDLTGTFNGVLLSGGPIVGAGTTYTATLINPLPVGSYKPGLAISSAADTFVLNLQNGSTVTWTINDAPS